MSVTVHSDNNNVCVINKDFLTVSSIKLVLGKTFQFFFRLEILNIENISQGKYPFIVLAQNHWKIMVRKISCRVVGGHFLRIS